MAAETSRAPEDVPLPASENSSVQADENALDMPERLRSSPINDENNTSCCATFKFADFIDPLRIRYALAGNFRGRWMEASDVAVLELPHGGMITIPLPSSTEDDLKRQFERFHGTLYFPYFSKIARLQALSEASLSRHPNQVACSSWASYAWDSWSEYKYRPSVVISTSTHFHHKDKKWVKDDLIEYWKQGAVEIWTSVHAFDDLSNPELISAEFHIILNSIITLDSKFLNSLRNKSEVVCEAARDISLQQMGSVERSQLRSWTTKLPLFFHRINRFGVAHSVQSFQAVTATHRRDKGRFPTRESASKPGMSKQSWFYESCISIVAGFEDSTDGEVLRFIFTIEDRLSQHDIVSPRKSWQELQPRERAGFLPEILRQYYHWWEQSWNGCLDEIDNSVKITLADLSDNTKLDTFMFDGPNFERSRSYFAALQLLRIFSDRVKETRQDLAQATKQLGQHPSLFESTGLKEAESRLLQRIDRKTEEIKTLRDGLFNSTSVREATRATQMNRYVIVFTVVTVLYTPPSFISTLFATPLPYFTKGDPDDFKRAVGIATGTTVLAAIILLVIANSFDDVVRNPKDRLSPMVQFTRARGRSLLAKLQSFAWVPLQIVQESGRTLREFAEKAVRRMGRVGQQGTQNTAPEQSRGQTEQRHHGQDIDLPDRIANAATPPRNDHGGNIV